MYRSHIIIICPIFLASGHCAVPLTQKRPVALRIGATVALCCEPISGVYYYFIVVVLSYYLFGGGDPLNNRSRVITHSDSIVCQSYRPISRSVSFTMRPE